MLYKGCLMQVEQLPPPMHVDVQQEEVSLDSSQLGPAHEPALSHSPQDQPTTSASRRMSLPVFSRSSAGPSLVPGSTVSRSRYYSQLGVGVYPPGTVLSFAGETRFL